MGKKKLNIVIIPLLLTFIFFAVSCGKSDFALKIDKKAPGYSFIQSQISDVERLKYVKIKGHNTPSSTGGQLSYIIPRSEEQQLLLDLIMAADFGGAKESDRIVLKSPTVYLQTPEHFVSIQFGAVATETGGDGPSDGIIFRRIIGPPSSPTDVETQYYILDADAFCYDIDEIMKMIEAIPLDKADEQFKGEAYHLSEPDDKTLITKEGCFFLQAVLDNTLAMNGNDGTDRSDLYDMAFEFCGACYLIDTGEGYYSRTIDGKTEYSQFDIENCPILTIFFPGFFSFAQ